MSEVMTVNRESVLRSIFETIDEINETLPDEQRLEKSVDTRLFGRQGRLDSLGLVNFIVLLEQRIADDFDMAVTLADEKAISRARSPFRSVENLADYVIEQLKGTGHG